MDKFSINRIEQLLQNEQDHVKRWHYKKILKETTAKIEAMKGRKMA